MKYERLTYRTKDGVKFKFETAPKDIAEAMQHASEHVPNAINRLAELEDKIEAGTLVEVVRCKDCVSYKEAHYEEQGEQPYIKHVCKPTGRQIRPNSFCSYGITREQWDEIFKDRRPNNE